MAKAKAAVVDIPDLAKSNAEAVYVQDATDGEKSPPSSQNKQILDSANQGWAERVKFMEKKVKNKQILDSANDNWAERVKSAEQKARNRLLLDAANRDWTGRVKAAEETAKEAQHKDDLK
jgi:hypothetical protein